ncbi:MAG: hypothetical protein ACRDIZ_04400 [Actinomycetota bacterium]
MPNRLTSVGRVGHSGFHMARETLDGRLVTRCDGCGGPVEDGQFAGVPGLTEFLGSGICATCREQGVEVADVLMASDLLSAKGRQAVQDWLLLQAPDQVRDLAALLREDQDAARRLRDGRVN